MNSRAGDGCRAERHRHIIDGWDGDLSVFAGVSEAVRPLVERTRHMTREDVQAAGAATGDGPDLAGRPDDPS